MKNILSLAVTAVVAVLTMAGCGKNDSGTNNSLVGPYGYNSCAGCAGNTQLMTTATSQDSLGEVLQLQFYGQTGASYASAYSSQYTQVAAQGILTIQGQSAIQCGMPAGQYQVTSYQAPAVMSGQTIQSMTLIAQGPVQAQLQVNVYFTSPSTMQIRGQMLGQGGYGYSSGPCSLVMY